jgi:hypothetical protein
MSTKPSPSSIATAAINSFAKPLVQTMAPLAAPLIAQHIVAPLTHAAILHAAGASKPAGSSKPVRAPPSTATQNPRSVKAGTKPGSGGRLGAPQTQFEPMDVDEPLATQYNPDGLDENCVFISMAYLLDPTGERITAKTIVDTTGEMQPADGSGGVAFTTLQKMLNDVSGKLNKPHKSKFEKLAPLLTNSAGSEHGTHVFRPWGGVETWGRGASRLDS